MMDKMIELDQSDAEEEYLLLEAGGVGKECSWAVEGIVDVQVRPVSRFGQACADVLVVCHPLLRTSA